VSATVSILHRERGDAAMTAERKETKYLVPYDSVDSLVHAFAQQLPSHRFTGHQANRLPDAHHYVTTVYFDTASHAHYRAALRNAEHNVKLRAKEYYDVHPSLAEVATDSAELLRYHPWLWFELKRREGERTLKCRFRLPKRDVPAFFAGERLSADPPEHSSIAPEAPNETPLEEIERYCRALGEPLTVSCLVNYRRLSFQDAEGNLRITLDLGLAFYAPLPELWTRERPLERSGLGRARETLPAAVLEVKRRAALPEWLSELLEGTGLESSAFSKFAAAARAVHGDV
jgi:SPX domain protein involved in polyphosphate accumulation